jgi:hypothetical protein
MAHLVNQPHGIQRAGIDGQRRVFVSPAALVHAVGKFTTGAKVGENYVATESKQRPIKFIAVAGFTRNMKFHGYPSKKGCIMGNLFVRCGLRPAGA